MEYRIVRALPADWERVRSIRLRSLADAPDAFASELADELQLTDDQRRSRSENDGVAQFLALSADGEAVGLAVGAPYKGAAQTAGLFAMWVAPAARNCGIGAALVQAVIDWAHSEKHRRILLDVGTTNAPAIRLYESCGFAPTGKTGTLPPPRQHLAELQMEKLLR